MLLLLAVVVIVDHSSHNILQHNSLTVVVIVGVPVVYLEVPKLHFLSVCCSVLYAVLLYLHSKHCQLEVGLPSLSTPFPVLCGQDNNKGRGTHTHAWVGGSPPRLR